MKIGLAVGFFDFRNDVRALLDALLSQHEVVIFCQQRHAATVARALPPSAQMRVIDERPSTLREAVVDKLFQLFHRLPASRQNHYLMERFKISATPGRAARAYARLLLAASALLPAFLRYDRYLDMVACTARTKIDDIDFMLFFTEIVDDRLLARCLREQRRAAVYVYSWDHPCKHVRFTSRLRHLVWNDDIGADVVSLQDIPVQQIAVVGATALGFLEKAQARDPGRPAPELAGGYIYFGCSIGIPDIVAEEIAVVHRLADALDAVGSPLKLLVRPYPVLGDWTPYATLAQRDRIVLDDQFRTTDLSVREDDILAKYDSVKNAVAFFHLGTTLGFECCFTDTPSFIIDYGYRDERSALSLRSFVHQYQLEKYLLRAGMPNVIRSDADMRAAIVGLQEDRARYLAYNRAVVAGTPLKSFQRIADDLVELAAA